MLLKNQSTLHIKEYDRMHSPNHALHVKECVSCYVLQESKFQIRTLIGLLKTLLSF